MFKKITLITSAVVLIVGIGYSCWYFIKARKFSADNKVLEDAGKSANIITENASKGVLPDVVVDLNPVNNVKIVNPADEANPFKNIKTNPFE